MRRIVALPLLAVPLFLPSAPALPQTMMNLSTIDLGISQMRDNSFLFQSMNQSMATTPGAGGTAPKSSRAAADARPAGGADAKPGPTGFKPVAPSLVPKQLAARASAKRPEERPDLEKFFSELLADYKQLVRENGAPMNDVARSASFMAAMSYHAYYGQPLPMNKVEAVREQMRRFVGSSENFRRMTDRRKQELYEYYAIMGMYVSGFYDGAVEAGNQTMAAKMHDLGGILLEELFNVPVTRISFTDAGIRY